MVIQYVMKDKAVFLRAESTITGEHGNQVLIIRAVVCSI